MAVPGCFQMICSVKYLKKEGMAYQQTYIEMRLFQGHLSRIT